jgi:hypothetical protein
MTESKTALLLLGSARAPSTSASLGGYLMHGLGKGGFKTQTLTAWRTIKTSAGRQELIRSVQEAHLMVLAFPLYVDCLPYPLIRSLEIIAAHFKIDDKRSSETPKQVVAVVNCGFPEAHHNQTALDICRQFACQMGWGWSGGLAMGGGGIIDGKALNKVRWVARNVIKALDLSAAALCRNDPIPEQAVRLMAKPLIPHWLYRCIATVGFKHKARKLGTAKSLDRQPFNLY